MNRYKIYPILLILFLAFTLQAKEYHVAKDGNDRSTGSSSQPFFSIGAAALHAEAGDTVTVHEGIYRERVNPLNGGGHDLNRILYRSAEGEEVIIKGSENYKRLEET